MRKRSLLYNKIIGKPIENANYADICFYDKENDNKIIVDSSEVNNTDYPLERFTPIGIVAVPSFHTDENRPRIVSLAEMNYSTLDSGSVTEYQEMNWGGHRYTVTNLAEKRYYPYLSSLTESASVNYDIYFSYLPSDYFSSNNNNPLNSLEGFQNSDADINMCSPYKEDGSKEERYFDTSNTGNVLADFDGKGNTEKILSVDNSNSIRWQTASTIENSSNNQYVHPPAQCCWRFHTDGTKQGEWYLPSVGELGYAYARQVSINTAIDNINAKYNKTLGINFNTSYYWSSTQYSSNEALDLGFGYGMLSRQNKFYNLFVRAFLIV